MNYAHEKGQQTIRFDDKEGSISCLMGNESFSG